MMVEIDKLSKRFGPIQAVREVSFKVDRGEVLGFLGPNGAGKSTTMKSIMGLLGTRSGAIEFAGRRIDRLEPFRISRAGIGYVPEDRRIFTDLTVLENLAVGHRPPRAGAPAWSVERLFALFPNLAGMPQRPGGRMSGGEQQMLAVARTLMGNPRLVLLDEPSEGVAPVIVEQMADMIVELKKHGLSVLLSEQNLAFASAVGDRACVLEKGQVKFSGAMAALDADEAVRRQYLAV